MRTYTAQEKWAPAPGLPQVEVSCLGRVRRHPYVRHRKNGVPMSVPAHIYSAAPDAQGYPSVTIQRGDLRKTIYVHRLVAGAFVPNPEGKPEVNHIDGDKSNNHVSNLEWCTRQENIEHAWRTGLSRSPCHVGELNPNRTLGRKDVAEIRSRASDSSSELAAEFGVSASRIQAIWRGEGWGLTGSVRTGNAGEQHGNAVLTDDDVRSIRRRYLGRGRGPTQRDLAREFGVSRATIGLVVSGITWTHIDP